MSSSLSSKSTSHDLFSGPGEMPGRARAFDWGATPLGAVETWPVALRAAVRLMLGSPVATSLWCGPTYTLLYNDAYSRILGAKHPHALGRSGAAVWDELWPALKAQFSRVRAGGPAIFEEESLLTMERLAGGEAEDAWFTYSLSALTDEAGDCLAVYNVAVEITEKVRARADAEAERARASGILETMADAHFVLDAQYRFVSVNAASERGLLHSRDELIGRTLWEVFPATVGTIFEESYRRVVEEGVDVHFIGEYGDESLELVTEVDGYPARNGGIAVFWRDITPRVRMEAALRASEQRLRDIFEQTPVAVAVMTGPEHIYTAVSPMYAKTPGLGRQLLGRSMRDAFPEVVGKGYIEAMDAVYQTGVPFSATERGAHAS